jgi:hypothetical protein
MKLYHATYDKNFESILFNGLNPKLGKKSWRVSDLNYVFLSSDPNLAKWYAVAADLVNSETKKKILIYEVDSELLERSKLKRDSKAQQRHQGKCYEYEGTIEYKKLKDFEPK